MLVEELKQGQAAKRYPRMGQVTIIHHKAQWRRRGQASIKINILVYPLAKKDSIREATAPTFLPHFTNQNVCGNFGVVGAEPGVLYRKINVWRRLGLIRRSSRTLPWAFIGQANTPGTGQAWGALPIITG